LEQQGFEADDLIATYVRQACEAGATATIVASDKDLMQLVNDCVVMYDTMKDRRIGIPEVIEKFGGPPNKVIEVQALIGDSTDNVPGVPGIGVKTAAQLIGEYGDLETLLTRAGEIKQEKRRQSLIEHADKARLSKKLVTLDDQVELDVPLADLVVHEPDYKHLIAFLKAMEFTTLTRRVAEFSGVDAGAIESDDRLKAGAAPQLGLHKPAPTGQATSPQPAPQRPAGSPGSPAQASLGLVGGPIRPGRREPAAATEALTPRTLATARADAAHKVKIDRARYETVRSIDRLNAWVARAGDLGQLALVAETTSLDPMQAVLCGVSLALGPNEACYLPLAPRQGGGRGNGRASTAPHYARRHRGRGAGGAQAAARRRQRAQDRTEPEIRPAAFRPPRHRARALRRHHVDVLRGGCRTWRARSRRTGAALLRSRHHRRECADRFGKIQ